MQMSIFQQHSLDVSAVVRMHRTPPIDRTNGRTLAVCLQGSNAPVGCYTEKNYSVICFTEFILLMLSQQINL
jgi:hypothetical protein